MTAWGSIEELQGALRDKRYIADRGLATAIYLATSLRRPLFLEGDAGVGKTEVARTLAEIQGAELIRLQCYEGIDSSQALYDWNYQRQFLAARTGEAGNTDDLFTMDYLIERPLLRALRSDRPVVLLIDEIDRADDEFEAFLLEILSDYSVTIPEIGTIAALEPPVVVLTSNRTREVHDALKRRCYYHLIRHPSEAVEADIIRLRSEATGEDLAAGIARAVARIRALPLAKPPGLAESIDWASALAVMGAERLDEERARETLGALIKQEDDLELVLDALGELVRDA